jgi:hypothetical protein
MFEEEDKVTAITVSMSNWKTGASYKLKCVQCNSGYRGRTGRSFRIKYKEHIRNLSSNKEVQDYPKYVQFIGLFHRLVYM